MSRIRAAMGRADRVRAGAGAVPGCLQPGDALAGNRGERVGGETYRARAQLYQTLGLMAVAFGLFLAGSGFWRWVNGGTQRQRLHG